MKRELPFSDEPTSSPTAGKSKMAAEDTGGMDELLAVLGYKVRSTDMADVALKLEQLAQVMDTIQKPDELSSLASDTVHFNPSDINMWLESMLSELNPPHNSSFHNHPSSTSIIVDSFSDSDLQAIPGKAVLTPPPQAQQVSSRTTLANIDTGVKRIKIEGEMITTTSSIPKPLVVVDSQENGIRLVHTLLACAEAIQQNNTQIGEALVKRIGFLAASQVGSMRKVATYFAEGLARRIYNLSTSNLSFDDDLDDKLEMHFYEACPYIKFAHFTTNQAILEAFNGKRSVHVVDFSLKQGMQWPALMQALAVRPEGPPVFRLTGFGPAGEGSLDRLHEVGWKLGQFAESMQIRFEFCAVAKNLCDFEPGLITVKPDEVVAVNSVFELHRVLGRPGLIEKVMGSVRSMNPVIVTIVEQEANHNGSVFLDRFNESLHYYSALFDSLERCAASDDKVMSEVYLGRQICNVVACEGVDRVERHETMTQWRTRLNSCGFDPVHLGSNVFKQASMLLEFYAGGEGYGVEEREGCLMLGWHNRPLITTSAWKLGKKTGDSALS